MWSGRTFRTDRVFKLSTGNNNGNLIYNYYGPGSYRGSEFLSSVLDKNPSVREHKNETVTGGKDVLQVQTVDFKISDNAKAHHTFDYDICKSKVGAKLVVRRGQPFTIAVTFSKKYDEKIDDLRLVFEAGDSPLPSKGTSVEFILSHEDKKNEWGAQIDSQKDNTLMVTVFTPPNLFVGQWKLKIDVVKKEDTKVTIHRYLHNDPVYIIFNPWCKDDEVYMEGGARLNEYVLNQSGGIFVGSQNSISYRPWNFAQFESCVLDLVLYLLDKSGISWTARGNPILIVRKLSALVNSQDDSGLLVGNWNGNYSLGHAPTEWTGSSRILEKYWKTKTPVMYGQCWVFSGLCTTLCRALGIPARSVTNFQSAHDCDGNLSLDYYRLNDAWKNDDSVWNFHVWNEAWMARPDLPHGYGGWQAFDATPQETSEGIYCCGPASVRAIREGKIDLPYDGPFVFSEVNADKVFWVQDFTGQWQCVDLKKDCIGMQISTKAIGSHGKEDLTEQYKPKEGTMAERISVSSAYINAGKKDISKLNQNSVDDIQFTVTEAKENKIGENFELLFTMKNTSDQIRKVNGHVEVNTMYYTGVVAEQVKAENLNQIVLQPKEEKTCKIVVSQSEYEQKLKDFGMFDVSMWASVEETEQSFVKKSDYRLHRPHLLIKAPTKTKMGEEMNVDVSFINPLNVTLTKCFLLVDGVSTSKKFQQGNVQPKGTFTATVSITPSKVGMSELIVNFNSEELKDVNATFEIEII